MTSKSAKKFEQEAVAPHLALIPKPSHSLFWNSNLFSDVYLQNDVPQTYSNLWNGDDAEFQIFLEQFRNYCESFQGEKPHSWSERTTIDRAIKPVLRMLGWGSRDKSNIDPWLEDESFSFQEPDGVKTYKPDFLIVDDHKQLKYIQTKKGQAKLEEARRQPNTPGGSIITIEAKYWDRIEELRQNKREDSKRSDKKENAESTRGLDFDDQCLKYMQMLGNEYGILTDGKTWRLYNLSQSTQSYKPYFQFNLGHMIRHVNSSDFLTAGPDYDLFVEQIKYFFFIFRKKALHSADNRELFVDELLNYSKKYVSRVEQDLKLRFVNAMTIACNGFRRAAKKSGENLDLDSIRNISESHIFNILFLKYCEARNILPIKQDPEGYRVISISNMLDKLAGYDPEKEADGLNYALLKARFKEINYAPDDVKLYDRLVKLTSIVQDGNRDEFTGFAIKGFKSSIFSKNEWKFVQKLKLTNTEMVQILFELGFAKDGNKFQQIPYNSFSPRQLGSIYESFLEFKLENADTDMAFIGSQWVKANLESNKIAALDVPKVKKGQLFFSPGGTDRKATGSFYTPDPIVQHIISASLGSLVEGATSEQVLKIKLCDPSMGSGHFLSSALNYLAKTYLEKLDKETHDDLAIGMTEAKRLVLHNCIHGVDINHRAVKLAKMSLWLESASADAELEPLDDQLMVGDSLELSGDFTFKNSFKEIFSSKGGFDCVVGNPPWVSFGLRDAGKLDEFAKTKIKERYANSAEYKISTYALFMEQFIHITRTGGINGLIVPDSFLVGMYFSKIRKFMCTESSLRSVFLINGDFWDGACTGFNVIYTLEKGATHKPKLEISFANGLEDFISGKITKRVTENDFESNSRTRFRLLFDERIESFVRAMESESQPLSEFGTVRTGVRSKIGQKALLSRRREKLTFQKGIISGSSVTEFKCNWDGDFINIDPKLLNMGGWDKKVIGSEKLLIRQTADNIIAGIDRNGLYHLNNCHSYISDKGSKAIPIEFIAAAMNSDIMRSYYTFNSMETGRAMAQIDIDALERIPIKIPKDSSIVNKVIQLVLKMEKASSLDKVAELKKEVNTIMEKVYGVDKLPMSIRRARHFCPKDLQADVALAA